MGNSNNIHEKLNYIIELLELNFSAQGYNSLLGEALNYESTGTVVSQASEPGQYNFMRLYPFFTKGSNPVELVLNVQMQELLNYERGW